MLEVNRFAVVVMLGFSSYLPLICLSKNWLETVSSWDSVLIYPWYACSCHSAMSDQAGIQFLFTPDMLVSQDLPDTGALGFSSYLPLICLRLDEPLSLPGWDSVLIYPWYACFRVSIPQPRAGIQFLFTPDMLVVSGVWTAIRLGFSSYLPLICLLGFDVLQNRGWDSVLIYPWYACRHKHLQERQAGIQFLFTPDMLARFRVTPLCELGFSSYLPLICLGQG